MVLRMAALLVFSIVAALLPGYFWQQLRVAWREPMVAMTLKTDEGRRWKIVPLGCFLIAMMVALFWFQQMPAFGFGLALSLCFVFPAARWLDFLLLRWATSERGGHSGCCSSLAMRLGLSAHPEQTLVGRLFVIVAVVLLLRWSLQVYHGSDSYALIVTLIAAFIAAL